MLEDPWALRVLLIVLAFVPPLAYTIAVRNVERFHREPLRAIFFAFFFGAIVSVFFALVLSMFVQEGFVREYQLPALQVTVTPTIILVLVVAPFVEELSKGFGVRAVRSYITEWEDGIVYGAAAGLGFSATENLFYELASLEEEGGLAFIMVATLRSITSSFLHATASGILGFGLARKYLERRTVFSVIPAYLGAVLLHMAFNALALLQAETLQDVPIFGLALVIVVAVACIRWTVGRIRALDAQRLGGAW